MDTTTKAGFFEYDTTLLGRRIGELLAEAKKSGTTANKIANTVGISRSAMSKYGSGEAIPSIQVLVNLAHYFNISTDYLLGLTDIPTANPTERAISEITGLTSEALKTCKDISKEKTKLKPKITWLSGKETFWCSMNDTLNQVISNPEFPALIRLMQECITSMFVHDLEENLKVESEKENTSNNTPLNLIVNIKYSSDKSDLLLYRLARKIEAMAKNLAEKRAGYYQKEINEQIQSAISRKKSETHT